MKFELFENIFYDSTSDFTKVRQDSYLQEGKYPIIDQGQEFIGGYTNDEAIITHTKIPVILFGDHTKVFKLINFPFTIGADGVKVLSLKNENYSPSYFFHFFKTIKLVSKGYSRHFKYLKDKILPIPESIKYQTHIANILTQAETLIAQRKKSIALLDEYLKSSFLEMFGDPVRNEKGWRKVELQEIASIQGGLQVTTARQKNPIELPYLRVANVYRNNLNLDEIKTIRVTKEEQERVLLHNGDILVVEGHGNINEIGRCSIWNAQIKICLHQNHLIRVRVDKSKTTSTYVSHYINSPSGKQQMFKAGKTTSGLNTISSKVVKEIKILIPPISLQNQFAQIVQKTEALKVQYKASLEELQNVYGALSQKAFKGELVMPKVYTMDEPMLSVAAEPAIPYKEAAKNELSDDEMLQLYFMTINIAKHKGKKEEAYLAEVKMEKSCHLGEYNIPQLQFNRKPVKEKHGPVDFIRLNKLLAYAKTNDIFYYDKSASFEKYTEGNNFNSYFSKAMLAFRPFMKAVNNLLQVLFPLDTNTIDLYATTFAAWNNLLLLKKPTTVKDIAKEARWHELKKRFSDDDIKQAIGYLKENDLVPMGVGSIVKDKMK